MMLCRGKARDDRIPLGARRLQSVTGAGGRFNPTQGGRDSYRCYSRDTCREGGEHHHSDRLAKVRRSANNIRSHAKVYRKPMTNVRIGSDSVIPRCRFNVRFARRRTWLKGAQHLIRQIVSHNYDLGCASSPAYGWARTTERKRISAAIPVAEFMHGP
jgi:hypothetical protein